MEAKTEFDPMMTIWSKNEQDQSLV